MQGMQYNSQDKKRQNKLSISKQNINNIRFNIQNQQNFDQQQFLAMNNASVPLSSNAVLQQDTWADDNSQNNSLAGGNNNGGNGMNSRGGHHSQGPSNHYKIGSKLKLGAATSTNFMKNVNQPNSFNMSMLRSVQQNMPNVSKIFYQTFILINYISERRMVQTIKQSIGIIKIQINTTLFLKCMLAYLDFSLECKIRQF